jgi:cbb3-type cytochrome oxidase maturation protein
MSVILLLIPLSLAMAGLFLGAFVWAVRRGQYEDTCTPSMRILVDDGTEGDLRRDLKMNGGNTDEN